MVSITAKKRINYIRIYNSQDRLQVKQEDQGKIIVVLKPTRWVRGAPEVCRVGETSSEFTSFITAMQFLCKESHKFMHVALSYDNALHIWSISSYVK